MKLTTIETTKAVGQVLCHDVTKIVPGEFKGRLFRKGHIIREEDIDLLLSAGKDVLYVWDDIEGMVHENDAADRLQRLVRGRNISISEVKEGKINLISEVDGTLKINTDLLYKMNMIDEVIVATKPNHAYVKKGDVIAATRVIPLLIDEQKLITAEQLILNPIINVKPIEDCKIAMVTTGNEIYYGRIKDRFKEVIERKLEPFNTDFISQTIVKDEIEDVKAAIQGYLDQEVDVIICTGGMSVDPSDITPSAIMETGSHIVTYGMPVLSGSMTLIAYNANTTILGLPAGVIFAEKTTLDLILHRVLSKDPITREEVAHYGNGGLL